MFFFVFVIDVCMGCFVIMNSGFIIRVLLVFVVVLLVFSFVLIDDIYYVDGGIMNNFFIEFLEECCIYILGSYVSFVCYVEVKEMWNFFNLVGCLYELVMYV